MSAPGHKRRRSDGGSNSWETPPELFAALDREFRFGWDGAASAENKLCDLYFGEDMDEDAFGSMIPCESAVFCNPPYGGGLSDWVDRFNLWANEGRCTVVALLPSAEETAWYRECVRTADEERRTPRRVRFLRDGQPVGSNTGGSAIFVWWPSPQFRPDWRCRTSYWDWL